MSADGKVIAMVRPREPAEHITPQRGAELRSLFAEAMRGENPLRWAQSVYDHMAANALERRPAEYESWPVPPSIAGNGNPALIEAARKSDIKSSMQIRLRASTRAEVIFRAHKAEAQSRNLAAYHRDHWRIARVSDDLQEREQQIVDALKVRYGR